jgi:hypothetical protein
MKVTITKLKKSLSKASLNLTEMETIKGGASYRSRPMKRRKFLHW